MSGYQEKYFQRFLLTLIREIEQKQEILNELRLKFNYLDKEYADTLISMSILNLEISELENMFERQFNPQ